MENIGTNSYQVRSVGYVDHSGKFVIQPRFEAGAEFSGGLAAVRLNDKWGYVDKTGRIAITQQFAIAGPFVNGRALVFLDTQPKSTNAFEKNIRALALACIDIKGKVLWGPKSQTDQRTTSDRMMGDVVFRSVSAMKWGEQTVRDNVEAHMKQFPRAIIPLLKEYEKEYADDNDPDFKERIHRVIAFLSSDAKATDERLMKVLQQWGISESGVKVNSDRTYNVSLYNHPITDLSPLKGMPIKGSIFGPLV